MSNKYENSFSDLWKKNNGLLSAIDSVSKIIDKANIKIDIYSQKLKDELYANPEILSKLIAKLDNKAIKVRIVANKIKEDSNIKVITDFLSTKYPNFTFLELNKNEPEDMLDFIISDDKYIRIEFDKEGNRARFIDGDEAGEQKEAQDWIPNLNKRLQSIIDKKSS